MINRVTYLVAQDAYAPRLRAPFHLKHLTQLETRKAGMCEVEWNRNTRHAIWSEPFIRKPIIRAESNTAGRQLLLYLGDPTFDRCALDGDTEVADADVEQLIIWPAYPDRFLLPGACAGRERRSSSWCFGH